jgi:hypothetical protein
MGAPLATAAQSTSGAGEQMAGLSGRTVDRHATVVSQQSRDLSTASHTDSSLQSHMSRAAEIAQGGGRQLDAIVAQTRSIAQVAGTARTPAAEMMVLKALRSQVAQAQSVVASSKQQAIESAGQVRSLSYGAGGPPQAPAADDLPADTPEDPPHGEDRRYWLDVSKIVYVPDGELAPANSVQVGPNMWYPAPDMPGFVTPPPPPAKYPLDAGDVRVVEPGELFPPGYRQVAPNIGVPDPDGNWFGPEPTWPSPQMPIDVRDVIEVPNGQLAPWGYVEYLPGWWMPDPRRQSLVGN